jgi:hypothetical protein
MDESLVAFWVYEAMEDPSIVSQSDAPSPEAWEALTAAREDRTRYYTETLPASIRAFCSPLKAEDAWSDEWIQRWAEDDSRERDRERIAALPAEIVADVRAAVATWREQTTTPVPETAARLEEGFIEALVADLAELVFDVCSASQEPHSKLVGFVDPAAWGPVIAEARGTATVTSK